MFNGQTWWGKRVLSAGAVKTVPRHLFLLNVRRCQLRLPLCRVPSGRATHFQSTGSQGRAGGGEER